MPSDPTKTPKRRSLVLIGLVALSIGAAIVARGIVVRAENERELARVAQETAIPTVALATVAHGEATVAVTLPGTIQAYQSAPIYAQVSGYVKNWSADIGAHVEAGHVLATIDTPNLDQQLTQAQANLGTAQANEQLAAVTAKRWRSLAGPGWVSQQANDEKAGAAAATKAAADAAAANVRQLEALEAFKTVVAPFDGIVTQRNVDVGALVNVGSGTNAGPPLFEVSDLHQVRIYVQVPQALSAGLAPGLKATFEIPQYPGQAFAATVVATSHAIDPASHSMEVELQADNPDGKFAQGTYCQVRFELPSDPNTMRLPATALVTSDRGAEVAVVEAGNKVAFKSIRIGRDFGDTVEVTTGLAPNDQIVDNPPETLQSGDTVRLTSTPAGNASTEATTSGR